MTPVWASMLRPVGSLAEKVRASPAAGAAKWLETLSEKAWPSKPLWFAIAVAVGPLSPTARLKLSLIALPWASVAVTVTVLLPKSLSVGMPEMTPVWASILRPAGSLAEKVRASPGGGSHEVTGDVKREGVAFKGALVCNGGGRWAAVADLEAEALADR